MVFAMIGTIVLFGIYLQEVLIRRPGFLLYRRLFIKKRSLPTAGSHRLMLSAGAPGRVACCVAFRGELVFGEALR